jgi:hypothetical protein
LTYHEKSYNSAPFSLQKVYRKKLEGLFSSIFPENLPVQTICEGGKMEETASWVTMWRAKGNRMVMALWVREGSVGEGSLKWRCNW